jgi:hypothetical protein
MIGFLLCFLATLAEAFTAMPTGKTSFLHTESAAEPFWISTPPFLYFLATCPTPVVPASLPREISRTPRRRLK